MAHYSELLFNKLLDCNATGDLIIDEHTSLSLKANQGALEEHKVSSSRIFGLRVIKEGRVGSAYSEAADEASLLSMVDQALTNASFALPEPHEHILDYQKTLQTEDTLLAPDDHSSIDDKVEVALLLEQELISKPHIKSVPYNGVATNNAIRSLYSSAGLQATIKEKSAYLYAYALAEKGEHNAMEGSGQAERTFDALNPQQVIETSYNNCIGLLEGQPIASGHYDVIFDHENQPSLFAVFGMVLSGKAAKDGINPWRDAVGKPVADPRLTLEDQPLHMDGMNYCLFDAEGSATKATPLIQAGTLNTLLHNSVTASYYHCDNTGHAARSAKGSLGVSSHQRVIHAGEANDAELYAGEYFEITDLTGLHSGANAISGDFSFGASGYLCRDGVRTQAVRGVTVAGNFYKMLNQINAIGHKQYWNWQKEALMAPIRFSQLTISGA